MRTAIGLLVWVLVVFLVLPADLDYAGRQFGDPSNPTGAVILVICFLAGVFACVRHQATALALVTRLNPGFIAFVLLATASLMWSADPSITARRVFRLYAFVALALAVALVGWNRTRLQDLMRPAMTFILVASLIFGLVEPDLALEASEFGGVRFEQLVDAWRGITTQKNLLGACAALGLLLWNHAILARETGLVRYVFGAGVSIACLVLSRSSTSTFAAVFASIMLVLLIRPPTPALRRYIPYIIGVFAALIVVFSLAVLNVVPGLDILLRPFTALSGKDLSFSGRSEIWEIIKEEIDLHPWLGIGYGAYWTGPVPGSPSYIFLRKMYFYPGHSHNGYLEVINELGFIGEACLIFCLIAYLRQGLRLFRIDRSQACLYLSFLILQFMANLSESHWLKVESEYFLIFTFVVICMARHFVPARR